MPEVGEGAIQELLARDSVMDQPTISLLGQGEGHKNFLAQQNGVELVVRTVRHDIPEARNFQNERLQLQFLEQEGIGFAPRSVIYDPEKEIHAITFIPGTDYSVADLPVEKLPLLVTDLIALEGLSYDKFDVLCGNLGIPTPQPETTQELLQSCGYDWLDIVKGHSLEEGAREIIDWVAPKIDQIEQESRKRPESLKYKHGDLRWHNGGGNLRLNGESLSFLDWESARFTRDNLLELGDIIASIPDPQQNKERINILIAEYAQQKNVDVLSLKTDLLYATRFSKLTDTLWSAQRYLQLKDTEDPNWRKYKEMTDYRMKAGDYYFNPEFKAENL